MTPDIQCQEIREFLDREKTRQTKNTSEDRRSGLRAFNEWLEITDTAIDEIDYRYIGDFFSWLTNDEGAGIADSTAKIYIDQVSVFYEQRIKKRKISESDNDQIRTDDITTPVHTADLNLNTSETEREIQTRNRARKGLSTEEMEDMVKVADSFRDQLILKVLAGTGCRSPSEIQSIRLRDVDLDQSRIKIRSTKTTNSREIPISDH